MKFNCECKESRNFLNQAASLKKKTVRSSVDLKLSEQSFSALSNVLLLKTFE